MIVKEYKDGETKIIIHNDYLETKEEEIENRKIIISLCVKNFEKISKKICKT